MDPIGIGKDLSKPWGLLLILSFLCELSINKRNNADEFVKNLKILAHIKAKEWEIPVIKTIASENSGIAEALIAIDMHQQYVHLNANRQFEMLAMKAFQLIQQKRMSDIRKDFLQKIIEQESADGNFNLYQFVAKY